MSSGYTHCGCRDCFETVVSDDMENPDLCAGCDEAGCEHDSECRAEDAYGGGDDALYTATDSCGRIELTIERDAFMVCSGAGAQDENVAELLRSHAHVRAQVASWQPDLLREVLREYGTWDADELADHEQNTHRMLWILCCDLRENES